MLELLREVWILLEFTKQALDKNIYDSYLCTEETTFATKVESSMQIWLAFLMAQNQEVDPIIKAMDSKRVQCKDIKNRQNLLINLMKTHTPMC